MKSFFASFCSQKEDSSFLTFAKVHNTLLAACGVMAEADRRMDLRQLEYFVAIARHRSITAAAMALRVAQPTVSKSLHLLETELGVALFVRLPRGVELTAYGSSLLHHAEQMRLQMRDALGELDALRGGRLGQVVAGAGPAWLRRHLPLAVARALATHPLLRVRVVGGFDDALLRALRQGELDFVVAELPDENAVADLEVTSLTEDELRVCCARDHPLAGRQGLTLTDLLGHPWVLPPPATRARHRLEALFISAGLPPPVPAVESESMQFLMALLAEMPALTYTTAATMCLPDTAGLQVLDVPALHAARRAGIMQRRAAFVTPATQVVITALRQICAEDPRN